MLIDLTKLIILLVGMWANGAADDWDVAAQVRFSVAFPGPTAALELALDPVPIYYRPLSPDLCGISIGIIIVDQRPECTNDVLQHEINHAWQLRTWGLAFPIAYLANSDYWEAKPPVEWHRGATCPTLTELAAIPVLATARTGRRKEVKI